MASSPGWAQGTATLECSLTASTGGSTTYRSFDIRVVLVERAGQRPPDSKWLSGGMGICNGMSNAINHNVNPDGNRGLPLQAPGTDVDASPSEPNRIPTAMSPGGTVLVVDDMAMNREVLGAFLRDAGYAVVLGEDGREAIRLASEQAFDVILMDVRMPEMDGLEATRRIRALPGPFGRVPVLALTTYAFREQVSACRTAGMDGHIAKPVDYRMLMRVINDAIARIPQDWPADTPVSPQAPEDEPRYPRLDRAVLDKMLEFLPADEVTANLQSLRVRKEQMVRLLDQSADPVMLTDAAHALGSAAGMFGFLALSKMSLKFERLVAHDVREMERLGPLLRAETCAALAALDGPLYERPADAAGVAHGVIVVENDPLVRGIIRAVLRHAKQQVFLAGDGLEAVVLATQFKVRLVLLDIGMPRLNGLLACEAIRAQPGYADVPIVMLTGYSDEPMRAAAKRVGATDFITKPFRPDELLERLSVHLEMPVRPLRGVFQDVPDSTLADEAIASDGDMDALRGGWLHTAAAETHEPHGPLKGRRSSLQEAFLGAGIPPALVQKWLGYASLCPRTVGHDVSGMAGKPVVIRGYGAAIG
jgi:CheY-like chemotaxis protein